MSAFWPLKPWDWLKMLLSWAQTSGAMYWAEPTCLVCRSAKGWARPRSQTLRTCSSLTRMFSSLMSKWAYYVTEWIVWIPLQICLNIFRIKPLFCVRFSFSFSIRLWRSPLWQSSMTMISRSERTWAAY
jgi:hypothetical protein